MWRRERKDTRSRDVESGSASGMQPGERLLAAAPVVGSDSPLRASDRALYLPGDADADPGTRLAWDTIVHAAWEPPTLVVEQGGGVPARIVRVVLEDPRRIPEVVRERVMATIVVSEHVDLVGDAGARIVGRRSPEGEGIRWTITFDPGLDPADPVLREAAAAALADLRIALGV